MRSLPPHSTAFLCSPNLPNSGNNSNAKQKEVGGSVSTSQPNSSGLSESAWQPPLAERHWLASDSFADEECSPSMFREDDAQDLITSAHPLLSTLNSDKGKDIAFSTEPPQNGEPPSQGAAPSAPLEAVSSEDESLPATGFLPVLKNKNFLTLWSGQVFSQLADKVYLVLMIAIIATRFQSAEQTISGWVSSIMVAFTIPAVLFGSIAGVFVDRWSKQTVLVLSNLLRGGLVFALPILLWLSRDLTPIAGIPVGFAILLGVTFLVSTLTQFFAPAEQSAIPLIVERRDLLSANSLYTTTMMASVIIGFAVGEPLLGFADQVLTQFGWSVPDLGRELLVGSGYAIAGLLLLRLNTGEKSLETNLSDASKVERPHIFQDIWDGLRYLRHQKRVRSAMIQLGILFSVFASLAVLSVRLAEVMPSIKSSQFGFLLAAGGVGMAIGATFLGQFGQHFSHTRLSLIGSIGMGVALAGLALFPHELVPALGMITLLGFFGAIVGVPMQTTIQEETPEDMRGKIFGLQNNAINIALSLPLALTGIAETFFGLRTVFIVLSILVIAGGSVTCYISGTSSSTR
ncbi:MAG TPA: MFS transporter [Leptolyngbyaceae cyanobacterium M33_DOE_097]|uniref:MFS transporter n=1 Tax=Oscillatoriales cyanobacterium SpSt-418 TaxID=2282169 RepID=A0A7C3PI80_9CYAN|nr:MFS transporter [Leptolyngbyaceae cyanobacterium M33_DOE_097]